MQEPTEALVEGSAALQGWRYGRTAQPPRDAHFILRPQHLHYTPAGPAPATLLCHPCQAEEAARRAEKQAAEAAKRAAEREERLRRAAQYQEPEWVRASEAAQQEEEETEVRAQLWCVCMLVVGHAGVPDCILNALQLSWGTVSPTCASEALAGVRMPMPSVGSVGCLCILLTSCFNSTSWQQAEHITG